ncbi:MAG TPA: type II toxin-antitoxin system HicB family antitoxin [Paenalcaligenes sp.]|nr:type II toxin-antitoxin system HicB family antitoxin [Paenalcaligenes sp.]
MKKLYPIYVHKDEGSAYGAIFPDIPGCFAAADAIDALPRAAQEAVEAHFGADDEPIPNPSSPDAWNGHEDYSKDGFWMMVDINLSKVRPRSKRINISMPEELIERIDRAAQSRGQSRSAFLASAAEREMSEA